MFFKLALLLSVEMFVLVAAITLLVYITRSQVNKWFTYGSAGIVIAVIMMMTCTFCGAVCMRHCNQNNMNEKCRFERENCHEGGMMCKRHGMMRHEECDEDMKECKMHEECGDMEKCKDMDKCGDMDKCKDGKMMHKEVIITTTDSMPKKGECKMMKKK